MTERPPAHLRPGEPGQLPRARTGVLVGMTTAAISFLPTLIPRSGRDQVIVTAASTLAGHGTGALAQSVINALPIGDDTLPQRLVATVTVGTAAAAVRTALKPQQGEPLRRAATRASAGLLAYSSAAGAVGLGIDAATLAAGRRSRPLGLAVPTALWGVGIGGALLMARRGLTAQAAARTRFDPPPPSLRRTLLTSGVAVAGVELGMLGGEWAVARTGRALGRTLPGSDRAWTAGLSVALGTGAGVAAWTQWDRVVARFRLSNAAIELGYANPPDTPAASGGPGSAVAYASLGVQGRRFVSDRVTTDRIAAVMGEPAVAEPVRLYVGMDTHPDQSERVRLALAELDRSGAYDRSVLVLASPSGTGYVNSIPVETVELLTRGDAATIAMQYDRKPSVLSLDKASEAAFQNRLLLSGIVLALRARPQERRPRILLYGESLGAHTSQDMFLHRGTLALEVAGVDRALWVGTPYASGWRAQVLHGHRADSDLSLVQMLRWGADAAGAAPEVRDHARVWLLDHPEDPVARFGIDLFVQRPDWIAATAPDRPVPAGTFWFPLVTGIGVLVDTVNAARVVPGQFRAFGHDYRADLARTVLVAYGLGPVTPEQMRGVEQALRDAERARSERIELGTAPETPRRLVERAAATTIARAATPPVVEPVPTA